MPPSRGESIVDEGCDEATRGRIDDVVMDWIEIDEFEVCKSNAIDEYMKTRRCEEANCVA